MSRTYKKISELIDEISMGPFGSDIKVEYFEKQGVPVLNGSNIAGVKLKDGFTNFVSHERAKGYKKAVAKRGDIVITHRGTLGQISYVPDDSEYEEYVISQSQFRVGLKVELINPIYFAYYFHTNEGRKRLLSFKSHVGVPALAQATTNFRLLDFPVRPKREQDAIANVLESIDKKIELNNCINAELETMAKTLYDYWFVQFDFPDTNGNPYKTSGGKMVYNPTLKREIPEGWEVAPLSSITRVSNESINPADYPEKLFKHFSIPVFDATNTFGVERGDAIGSNKFTVEETDLLVSKLNPWFNRVVYAMAEPEQICSTEFVVWRCPNVSIKNFMYMIATSSQFIAHCTQSATGTSNSHKRVNPNVMMRFDQPFNLKVAEKLGQYLESILKQLIVNQRENTKLASLRDWLLPMLMNGQVTVK
jgi:type I restriction enzyme S subunit